MFSNIHKSPFRWFISVGLCSAALIVGSFVPAHTNVIGTLSIQPHYHQVPLDSCTYKWLDSDAKSAKYILREVKMIEGLYQAFEGGCVEIRGMEAGAQKAIYSFQWRHFFAECLQNRKCVAYLHPFAGDRTGVDPVGAWEIYP